jgi:hypothetical protein
VRSGFLIITVGLLGGPRIAGILADATCDHRPGFTVLALLAEPGSFFFLLARHPAQPTASSAD